MGWENANSEEFDAEATSLVIKFMPEVCYDSIWFRVLAKKGMIILVIINYLCTQGSRTHMGNTMRLGSRKTLFQTPNCVTSKL